MGSGALSTGLDLRVKNGGANSDIYLRIIVARDNVKTDSHALVKT